MVAGQVGGRDNLLITRIKAPFSSFSLWLSAFRSASCYRKQGQVISHESCQKSATAADKSKLTAHEGVGEERGEDNGRHLSKLCGQP